MMSCTNNAYLRARNIYTLMSQHTQRHTHTVSHTHTASHTQHHTHSVTHTNIHTMSVSASYSYHKDATSIFIIKQNYVSIQLMTQ